MTENRKTILQQSQSLSRRDFLKAGALGVGGLVTGPLAGCAAADAATTRPNFLFIISDQMNLDALSAHGNRFAHTPNLDRLVKRGVTFMESHSTNPVCSPARSSFLTGRMPVETGVIVNDRPILSSIPNMGQWLGQHGYEPVYCGKWHLPQGWALDSLPGFKTLPMGGGGQGDLMDTWIAEACATYLRERNSADPFVLVASLLNPHDICFWSILHNDLVPDAMPFAGTADRLPPLPPNNKSHPKAPHKLDVAYFRFFNDEQWRYYLYSYYRMVEMLDADVGRILDGLEASGYADNTIVVFTSDHGEGAGRHSHVQKWYPYDEAMKVPLVVSCPSRLESGLVDHDHLVNSTDIISTMCDYAGCPAPPNARGRSLRPLLEGKRPEWREFTVSECQVIGRMVRTAQYKYVRYQGDPVEQLFDMKADPWEMTNLYKEARYADVIRDHRKLLDDWESRMIVADVAQPHI